MANSFQVDESAPLSGLGTFSCTPTVTGFYTLEFKSFLPFLAAGSPAQSTVVSREITDVTCVADSGGSKNDKYWTFNSAGDAYGFYVWYNINAAGTDPAVAGLTGIEVAGATGATAATLATATIAAINANAVASLYVVASAGASEHLIIKNSQYGDCTAAANAAGGSSYGATFSVTTAGGYGTPPASGLVAKIYNDDVLVATYAFPSPTQQILGGSARMAVTAGDDVDLILSSLSSADSSLNAVKTIVNFYAGV